MGFVSFVRRWGEQRGAGDAHQLALAAAGELALGHAERGGARVRAGGESRAPMGAAVIGGLLSSTVLTLVAVTARWAPAAKEPPADALPAR